MEAVTITYFAVAATLLGQCLLLLLPYIFEGIDMIKDWAHTVHKGGKFICIMYYIILCEASHVTYF